MTQILYVTGYAGTGKTTRLLELAAELGPRLVAKEHQRLLAMAVMHGARRRLEASFDSHKHCQRIPRRVLTIDSVALALVNRWRSSLGLSHPVSATACEMIGVREQHFRTYAGFTGILSLAIELLGRSDVQGFIRDTFPAIVIDEFQDCHGLKLEFVKRLADLSLTICAADDFQLLDTSVVQCPAVEWIEGLRKDEKVCCEHLTTQHRTDNRRILVAAEALRNNVRVSEATVPVLFATEHPIAFSIMERLVLGWYGSRWEGTFALICPSQGRTLDSVIASLTNQLKKRNCRPIHWVHHTTLEHEEEALFSELGLQAVSEVSEEPWDRPASLSNPDAEEIARRAEEFARLRGLGNITHGLVTVIGRKYLHARRSYGVYQPRYTVTTVHGAKNREFDNVFVLWPYEVRADPEQQRRMLYNAITRARKNCIVLAAIREEVAASHPVLSLLGDAKPVFEKRPKASKTARVAVKRSARSRKAG